MLKRILEKSHFFCCHCKVEQDSLWIFKSLLIMQTVVASSMWELVETGELVKWGFHPLFLLLPRLYSVKKYMQVASHKTFFVYTSKKYDQKKLAYSFH